MQKVSNVSALLDFTAIDGAPGWKSSPEDQFRFARLSYENMTAI